MLLHIDPDFPRGSTPEDISLFFSYKGVAV